MIVINTRVLQSRFTGVQRYVSEITSRFCGKVKKIAPQNSMLGVKGQLWEQLVLPTRARNTMLFSPSNTGPLITRKQVVTIHDVAPLDYPQWRNSQFSAWYKFLIPRLVRRVAHVITISEFSKRRLLDHVHINETDITVIPNGVDARFHSMDECDYMTKLQMLKLPSRTYVLCVNSLIPQKNIRRLLEAWWQVQNDISTDVWLVLVGARLPDHVVDNGWSLGVIPPRVHLTGHVPDELLPALYAGALAFVYPSVYEGFGLPPLEAMASGVPVLTGNQSALPEVVGETGVMVDPYDVDAIADGLLRLISDDDLRSDLSIKGIERAKQFNWDVTARKTWEILQRVDGLQV